VRAGLAESNGVFQRGEDSPVKSSTALTEAFFFTEKKKHSHHSQSLQQCRGRSHMDEQGSLSLSVCVCMNMCFRLCSSPASVFQPTLEFLLTHSMHYWGGNRLFSALVLMS